MGNLIYSAFARLLQVSGDQLLKADPIPALRVIPATFGTLTIPLIFILLRQLGASRRVALLGGVAALLDNGMLVESRLILLDSFLIFFGLVAITSYLAASARTGRERTIVLGASAFFAGCALSVKWTGASALGIILAAWFIEVLVRRPPFRRFVVEGLLLVGIPLAIYVSSFAVHFRLLDHSGPDEVFMSRGFEQSLIGSAYYNPTVHFPLWRELRDVHHAIRVGNESLERAKHLGSSRWYTWPIMKHPMGLWEPTPEPPGQRAMIILFGNPLVWWGALAGALIGVVAFVMKRKRFSGREFGFLLLLGAALLNFLPFAAIQRIMYIYHYLFALTFLIALAAFSTGIIAGWMNDASPLWQFPSRRSAAIYFGIIGLLFVSFVYFLPFTYGWPMSIGSWDAHFWVLHPHL